MRAAHIFGLLSCALYLGCNIAYDWIDIPCEYNCPTAADSRLFFIPFSLMVFVLSLICRLSAKQNGFNVMEIIWDAFMWLSILQVVKFVGFNPFLQMLSDYAVLLIIAVRVTYKIIKNARPSARNS